MFLPEDLYKTITDSVPFCCVDLLPVRRTAKSGFQIGVIVRATGSQAGKMAILGGRVFHNESLPDALERHLTESLGPVRYRLHQDNTFERPFHVQQYLHQDTSAPPLGFDPSKHAIALTYLVELDGQPKPTNEATDFRWITAADMPKQAAYNQQIVMQAAFHFLAS